MFGNKRKKQAAQPVRRRAVLVDDEGRVRAVSDRLTGGSQFRRNRTLTGSLVSTVSSPSEQSAQLQSPRVQAHALRRTRRKLRMMLFGVVVFVGLLGWILAQLIVTPKVAIISAPDNTTSQTAARDYQASIQRYLINHPLERLAVSLNVVNLKAHLQSEYPEVLSVSPPEKQSLWTADFSINLRPPVVLWRSGGNTAYVDSEGVVFSRNVLGKSVVAVEDKTGIATSAGASVISGRFLQFIGKTTGYFAERGYMVSKVILPADTTRQLLISLDGVAYPVKMTVDRPSAGQVEDAARSILYLQKQAIQAEYIDVRVSRRAYYK